MTARRPSLAVRLGAPPDEATAPPRLYAEVAVNASYPTRQTFSYGVPHGMNARSGMAAYVPFGKLTLQGIIVDVHDTPVFSEPEKIRDVRSLIGDAPIIDAERLELARWIAHEYIAPIFDAVALFLPPGFERKPLTIVHPLVDADALDEIDLPPRLRQAMDAIIADGPITTDRLKDRLKFPTADNAVVALERRGLVMREFTLARPSVSAKSVDVASLAVPLDDALARIAVAEPPKRSRRADVLRRLIETSPFTLDEAVRLAGSRANLGRLERAGAIAILSDTVSLRITASAAEREIHALTTTRRARQAEAIVRALDERGRHRMARGAAQGRQRTGGARAGRHS